jgi:lipopolysaccharide/colanic/teichoic acid biosynthesis glycosyltransferase
MKPGITCIWQVSGRNTVSFDRWMEMDLEYIDNWSLKLDLIILMKSVGVALKQEGYQEGKMHRR